MVIGVLTSPILFKYECIRGDLFVLSWGQGTTGCLGEGCFGVMYCEWYGVVTLLCCRKLRYVLTMVV